MAPVTKSGLHRKGSNRMSNIILVGLVLAMLFIASLNLLHGEFDQYKTTSQFIRESSDSSPNQEIQDLKQKLKSSLEDAKRKGEEIRSLKSQRTQSEHIIKAFSINSFWWPSTHTGLLGKIYAAQNPSNCSSESTKYLVWRSLDKNADDTRGLSAFGHTAKSMLMHALTDGDKFVEAGSRVLIQDEELWPMAKGCKHGPETRECYFEPLTYCKLSQVDPIHSSNQSNVHVLEKFGDEYNREVRTLYTPKKVFFRNTKDVYAWTGLPGGYKAHPEIAMNAASIAFYFNPKPWLRQEIHERLQKSIPEDLDPDKTIGVPIRRSDKCKGHDIKGSASGEMDCPSLETYLSAVKSFLAFDPMIQNVIVTSEDKKACDEFISLLKKELPQLRVVVNIGDVQQGTGSGSQLESYEEGATNAAVVASALTSLHMHMRARYLVITSKSTWTSTIALMARVFGFASSSDVFVIDIESNSNSFASLVKSGCI